MSDRTLEAVLDAIPREQARLEIVGEGVLARALSGRLGIAPSAAGDERPAVVVETTGRAHAIRAALERVADLGTVVLAGPLGPLPLALDLYADVHVRGLTIVGVTPAPAGRPGPA